MENKKLTDEMLENVAGAGIVPTESAYNISNTVKFHFDGKNDTGLITDLVFHGSTKTWSYYILSHTLSTTLLVPEADIDGRVS